MNGELSGTLDILEETTIQPGEASDKLRHYCDRLDLDPNRLFELEQCIPKQILLARKHYVVPEALPQFHQSLLDEQQQLNDQVDSLETSTLAMNSHHQQALEMTKILHRQCQHYAQELGQLVTEGMYTLSTPHGVFYIDMKFEEHHPSADGTDRIELKATINPGQPLQPTTKVAPDGELSHITLIIQAITAHKMETPAPIFDEVGVGISGSTTVVAGKTLRQLGESTQVMCVTHLSQVAGCGHQHLCVSKRTDGAMAETHIQPPDKRVRLRELACLLGGSEVARNTLANTEELPAT